MSDVRDILEDFTIAHVFSIKISKKFDKIYVDGQYNKGIHKYNKTGIDSGGM